MRAACASDGALSSETRSAFFTGRGALPMRYTASGTIQNAVARCYRAVGGVEAVAEQLGLANSTVSYGTEVNEARPGGIGVNYLARLGRANAAAAVPVAEFFCDLAGGVFQPVEVVGVTNLHDHCCDVAKECGEAQAATIKAAYSSKRNEIDEAEREIDEAIGALVRARAALRGQRGAA